MRRVDSNWAGWYIGCDSRENISRGELVWLEVDEEYSKCTLRMLMNLETQDIMSQ